MRTYKYKIRDHPKNKHLGNLLDDLADVHNHFLKIEKRYYRIYGKYAGRYRLQPHLTKLLKTTKKHWAWIPRQTLDTAIIRIDEAYQRFFKGLGGIPKLKRKHRYRSAKFQTGYKLENKRVRLSFKSWDTHSHSLKFNRIWFSFHRHRHWQGTVRYVQILRDSVGEYWLYIVTDDNTTESMQETGESVGIDLGIHTFATLSTGEKITAPEFLKRSLKKLRKLNKALSRKIQGSSNWWRAKQELARQHRKVARQRKDWQWKLAADICRHFDTIAIEPFSARKVSNFRHVKRKAYDLAPYQFFQLLEFKCFKHNRLFFKVESELTTQTCSDCGKINDKISLKDKQWICPDCDVKHDRDINAAINILQGCLEPFVEQI